MKQIKQYISYAFGAFGHDAFYATLSTYFMIFVTSQLFSSSNHSLDDKMIGYITTMIVVIRLVEIAFDPLIGGVVDNTRTRWGKFKPWIMIGATISSIGLILIFTNFGGLNYSNPILYLILFGIVFVILDVFYSFKDTAFWSMLPAFTLSSSKRAKFSSIARLGSTLGSQGVIIVIVPLVTILSGMFGAKSGQENQAGWLGFAIVIGLISFLGALATSVGTKEEHNIIRENTEKIHLVDVFKVIFKNDQLMWLALSYFMLAFSYTVTNSLFIYYFKYVMGKSGSFYIVGIITAILGIISVSLFPALEKLIHRKAIYVGGIVMMLIGYTIFIFSGTNVVAVLIGISLLYFPYPLIFLAALMTIADSVEYGQLKSGNRNESVTLVVRPLLDKLGGAFANAIVGITAIFSGMTGNAKPSSISAHELFNFKFYTFYGPMVLLIIAALVYFFKITLTEKEHDKVIAELENKLSHEDDKKITTKGI
ncbi:sodium:solute symporter [Oenococcus oeni IOEB_C23]|uniref:glycoside-pentoside-hexuronide (GPH):cation symporter n=1 Tax=Oenococcus oeni TaxID=1247 RepID=UPI00050FBEA7|nr:glycoside-pentoside-hexuronide (GPH):cation symporter [Oenococcus oeni]KGH67267.1 sodium:solute symporter [Oenococcus oeni IOEB_C23]